MISIFHHRHLPPSPTNILHFLAHQHLIVMNTITPTWITSIHSYAIATSLLSINSWWVPPKQRVGNIHIGSLPDYTNAQLQSIHQTFSALQVITCADIVDASRKLIYIPSFQCAEATSSPYHWPICKHKISRKNMEVWQSVLSWLISNARFLAHLLGQWLVAPSTMLLFHCTARGLVHIQSTEVWHLHLPAQAGQIPLSSRSFPPSPAPGPTVVVGWRCALRRVLRAAPASCGGWMVSTPSPYPSGWSSREPCPSLDGRTPYT